MQNIYTVAQINSYIKNMFTQDYLLKSVFVKGEISNCKYHSSGHIYFTLKDEKGTIACVMFAGSAAGLSFRMEEGQRVVVGGNIDVYERDGKYQLYAKQVVLDGAGLLYEKFEKLKKELEEMGMFAEEYKQPIPKYIKTLGVVTAPTGAAVQDIINITKRRNPYVQIILYPAIVQGQQAAPSIVNGIRALDGKVDVIIVGRGGGSIEDLWAFNEKEVAQAVFDCQTPVISAVGHETDTTIIDYVSDLRAPTPSAAAEQAVFEYKAFCEKLSVYKNDLDYAMQKNLNYKKQLLEQRKIRLQLQSPLRQIQEKRTYCLALEEKLCNRMKENITTSRHRLSIDIEKLKGMSPLDKLNQGYAFVEKENGEIANDVEKLSVDDSLRVYVRNGIIKAKVTDVERKNF